MTEARSSRLALHRLWIVPAIFGLALAAACSKPAPKTPAASKAKTPSAKTAAAAPADEAIPVAASDPWKEADLMMPSALADQLKQSAKKPLLLQIGFDVLYRGAHIPGSIYAGPASKPAGLQKIAQAVKGVAQDRDIVIYCGCCPWSHCPTVRPAFKKLKDMGYTNVHVLYIPHDFQKNWIDKGYPTKTSAGQS
ncbi:MAG: rhodanese-like domain-containing protein [Acidobacteriota bacterium]